MADPLDDLSQEEKEILADYAKKTNEGHISRRGALGALAGLGIGGAAGALGTQTARAGASTSDSDGNVGLPSDRVDVYGDGVDTNSLSAAQTNITNETLVNAYLSTDQSISAGNFAKIGFDSKNKDDRGEFDTTNNTWSPDETGWYWFGVRVQFAVGADGDRLGVRVEDTNGNFVCWIHRGNAGGTDHHQYKATVLRQFDSAVTYQVMARNNTSSDTVNGGDGTTNIWIRRAMR